MIQFISYAPPIIRSAHYEYVYAFNTFVVVINSTFYN